VRLTRLTFKVRHMMVAVAIVSLLLGVHMARQRWENYRREAAYHASAARYYALLAERRLGELAALNFRLRVEDDVNLSALSNMLRRPAVWAGTCRTFAADHERQKAYWQSRW
jgi:hypothetical protein